jgi:hypothetical protein
VGINKAGDWHSRKDGWAKSGGMKNLEPREYKDCFFRYTVEYRLSPLLIDKSSVPPQNVRRETAPRHLNARVGYRSWPKLFGPSRSSLPFPVRLQSQQFQEYFTSSTKTADCERARGKRLSYHDVGRKSEPQVHEGRVHRNGESQNAPPNETKLIMHRNPGTKSPAALSSAARPTSRSPARRCS